MWGLSLPDKTLESKGTFRSRQILLQFGTDIAVSCRGNVPTKLPPSISIVFQRPRALVSITAKYRLYKFDGPDSMNL